MRNFILGTDWWTDCDDVVAVRFLARMHKMNKIRLRAVVLDACMELSAPSLSAFLQSEGLELPIGLDREATDFGLRERMYQATLAVHPHYMTNDKCENGVSLYRRILSESDEPIEIIEIGYPQVLANLLMSGADEFSPLSGEELVRQKVSKLWIMAGNWQEEMGLENNFCRNERSRRGASYLLSHWDTEICFLGWEVGHSVLSGGNINDPDDLLYQAMAVMGFADGRSSWDPMLCLMACIGDEASAGYSTVRGIASVNADTGENAFIKDDNGKHIYVKKLFEDEYYAKQINEILSKNRNSN